MRAVERTFGRERALLVVSDFLGQVEMEGAALVVLGQAGVGKSHVIRVAAAEADARGISVLASKGVEHESTLRFAGLNHLLLPLRHEFVHLGSVQRDVLENALGLTGEASEEIAPVVEAARSLLVGITGVGPALITIDDLHHLDPWSRAVIAEVSRSVAGKRVGLLTSVCTDTCPDFDLTGMATCHLRPLSDSAAEDLLEHRFPSIDAPLRARVLAEAEGNPLMLSELPKLIEQHRQSSGERLPEVLPINGRLHHVFGSRLTALPALTRAALLLAALGLDPVTSGSNRSVTLESSVLDQLGPAEAARLVDVAEQSRQVSFRHPLVFTTVLAQSTSAERRDAHLALAQREPGQDGRVRHLAHVALEPDEHLAHELEELAYRRARQGHGVSAIEVLRHAADLTPQRAERARRLVAAAHFETDVTGDLLNAGRLLTKAHSLSPETAESLTAATTRARVLLHVAGDVDGAHTHIVAALRAHARRIETDQAPVVSALYLLADICAVSGRPDLSKPLIKALAQLGTDAPPLLTALTGLQGSTERISPTQLNALHRAVEGLSDKADPHALGPIMSAAFLTDELQDVRRTLRRTGGAGRAAGPCSSTVTALSSLAADSFAAGQWEESTLISREGETYSLQHDYLLASRQFQLDSALVAAARGLDDIVEDLTTTVDRWAVPRGALLLHLKCHRIRALSALGRGDFEGAYRHALVVRPLKATPGDVPLALAMTLDLVEAAVRTNRPEVASDHLQWIRDADLAALSPRLAMMTAAAAGVVAAEGARNYFDAALSVGDAEQWPFDLARVRLCYGERLRRMRAPVEARGHLQTALGTFTRLGASPWAVRARKELDATAMTKGGDAVFGPGSLTPQEREVAQLAASGLTNKAIASQLFISPRTVGAHLNHVFPKLGVTTRASLRDALQADSLIAV